MTKQMNIGDLVDMLRAIEVACEDVDPPLGLEDFRALPVVVRVATSEGSFEVGGLTSADIDTGCTDEEALVLDGAFDAEPIAVVDAPRKQVVAPSPAPDAYLRVSFTGKDLDALTVNGEIAATQKELRALVAQARIVAVVAETQEDPTLVISFERLRVVANEMVQIADGDRLLRYSDVLRTLAELARS